MSTLAKSLTGIAGLDEITRGGLPTGRPTLVCGGPGCGKTVLAMEFLVRGARELGEPGLFVSFEESVDDLVKNFRPLGFELPKLIDEQRLLISQVNVAHDELLEAGAFSLDGLLIRLEQGIAQIGAKRVVLDTLETLFSRLTDDVRVRAELARVLRWLKDRGVTSVVTGERGPLDLTRRGLEEYLADCVLLLDHRVTGNISKRRLRVVKYRGSQHGADEYPFLIGATGVAVFPITALKLEDVASTECVTTGVPDLDAMLGQRGYFAGSSVLVSGTAGTGKSTLAAAFTDATCERGDRCLYLAFEESPGQIVRNMQSVGIDLARWLAAGRLHVQAFRPTLFGLEEHLVAILRAVDDLQPRAVVMDPITNFVSVGGAAEVKSMLTRVFDHLKGRGITALVTSLTPGEAMDEQTDAGISSLMDTWLVVQHRFDGRRRRRWLYVAKSRGMDHSHELRELTLSAAGIALSPASAGA